MSIKRKVSEENCSDGVTRVNDSTRLESRFLVTRIRLESHWERWWLHPSNVSHRMTRLVSKSMTRDSSQSLFTISLSLWWANPVRLHTEKWAFLCFS